MGEKSKLLIKFHREASREVEQQLKGTWGSKEILKIEGKHSMFVYSDGNTPVQGREVKIDARREKEDSCRRKKSLSCGNSTR